MPGERSTWPEHEQGGVSKNLAHEADIRRDDSPCHNLLNISVFAIFGRCGFRQGVWVPLVFTWCFDCALPLFCLTTFRSTSCPTLIFVPYSCAACASAMLRRDRGFKAHGDPPV